jgi:hypothetical protein
MTNRTETLDQTFAVTNAWLIDHGFHFNNREWASLIWLGLLVAWFLPKAEVRQSLGDVARSAFSPKLLLLWLSFVLWIVIFVLLVHATGFWDARLTKDTLVWSVTVGLVMLAGFTSAHQPRYFRQAVVKIAGVTAFVEYFFSLGTFPLLVELFLQPVVLVFAVAPHLAKTPLEQVAWKRRSAHFFLVLGLVLIATTVLTVYSGWHSMDWRMFGLRAAWPVALGLWLLLLVFALGVVSSYEEAFMRLGWAPNDKQGLWRSKLGLVLAFGVRLEWIHYAATGGTYKIARANSVKSAFQAAREFRREKLAEKRAEQEYQSNLSRFAGNPGLDDHGRALDRREFRETTRALEWIHTCHMGWYRREPQGYKPYLLERIGDDFSRQGLPTQSRIVMTVSDDGKRWYAWRRTIGGHYFAIGASGGPPNQWLYDGRNPPTDFPGVAPEWGNSPFEDEAAPNWHE